eukprot:5064630-Amphidinium_carterae.1
MGRSTLPTPPVKPDKQLQWSRFLQAENRLPDSSAVVSRFPDSGGLHRARQRKKTACGFANR